MRDRRRDVTALVVLHGFTQNGARLRAHCQALAARLPAYSFVYPDAPNDCTEGAVERLYGALGTQRDAPPFRCWWDATDDGRVYRGWDRSLALLREVLAAHERPGLLGFSQGAAAAATVAALAARGALPPLRFAVLVAGRVPRADDLAPLFGETIALPSLHVSGERDPFSVPHAAELADRFDPSTRERCVWPGPHVLPTTGPGADAIVEFAARHAG